MSTVTYPDVSVKLTGEDGNVFFIIGSVARAIRSQHGTAAADAYTGEALSKGSYDEVLSFTMKTVNVE